MDSRIHPLKGLVLLGEFADRPSKTWVNSRIHLGRGEVNSRIHLGRGEVNSRIHLPMGGPTAPTGDVAVKERCVVAVADRACVWPAHEGRPHVAIARGFASDLPRTSK